ncbi:hypothetical protein [Pantoea ananatis]|uniref:hypothetical protein n=1 Tax=Pantoea ananas TaxID=553 RepID=UPI00048A7A81|nr:hypothetical protein [Pantoea ananatis]
MTTSKMSDNRSSKIIEILRSLLLLAGFFGLLTVGVLYGLPMMLHAKSENKLQQIGSLAMVKNNCHGFFYHDDDVSVLVMTSGYVVTVSGCVNAKPGTAVMEPETTLLTDGRDIGKYWCVNDICYERTDKEKN